MKIPRTANAVGYIDDDLIANTATYKKKNKNYWLKWGSLAACFAVLVIASVAILPTLFGKNINSNESDGRYKDMNILTDELAIQFPWEYRTVYEKYTYAKVNGTEYWGTGHTISEVSVGERLGNYTVAGYDEKHTAEFEVFALQDIVPNQCIAVKMEDNYYVFRNNTYNPPSTLGELMDIVNLSKTIELVRFSENGDGPNRNYFTLNNDDFIWEVLSTCKNATFVEDQEWKVVDRDYLSFTVTSDTLGVYKKGLYVTEDGYLWTNAFEYSYLFNIGEEASNKIINHSRENSTEVAYEPYRNSIIGTIIEITDAYILVDDSVLCKNPEDGITYKVLQNDLRISRYVDHGVIQTGDTVLISYEGEIDEANDNTIAGAISASNVLISDRGVFIPE